MPIYVVIVVLNTQSHVLSAVYMGTAVKAAVCVILDGRDHIVIKVCKTTYTTCSVFI